MGLFDGCDANIAKFLLEKPIHLQPLPVLSRKYIKIISDIIEN
jgi:hypothetical protein